MHWLLAGYMWLFIHRPFEVWPWLGDLRIERVYMLVTLGAWLLTANKGWTQNRFNLAVSILFGAILISWVLSPVQEQGTKTVEDFAKVAVFYVLLMSCIRDERNLRFLLTAFLFCMALYMAHSLFEYANGRHVYRMGTARMIGVDATLNDPNSFAASVVYALPLIIPFWRTSGSRRRCVLLAVYTVLSVTCVLLTGSRTGFMGISVCGAFLVFTSRYRWPLMIVTFALLPVIWMALPEDRQNRFLTLYDPSVGPASAHGSAESRRVFFWQSVDIWKERPLCGFGPDSFQHISGTGLQAHTLYGQVLSENGIIGIIALLGLLRSFAINARDILINYSGVVCAESEFIHDVAIAIIASVALLLLLGLGGHNLYRFTWLWYGAFLAIAVSCAEARSMGGVVDVTTGLDLPESCDQQCHIECVS